jgi:hypothetical protein
MKKLVFAFVMALASISLISAPMLRAQDSITIKDPAEFNTYQTATTQSDPAAKAKALEGFLKAYPQSVVKNTVLLSLIEIYQKLHEADNTLSAATRLLAVDPNNPGALYYSVLIKKGQCGKTSDPQTCDDAAALAHRGLTAPKPTGTSDAEWKTQTAATYPVYHSAIALDDVVSKKDIAAGISEYRTELMLYTEPQSRTAGLPDTYNLAKAYVAATPKDLVNAVWFFARAWDCAPVAYQAQIEPDLEYWYNKYHGGLDGLDAIKTQANATLFPPGTFVLSPAPTPAEIAHKVVVETPDLGVLNLEDKEFILANGTPDDVAKLWAILKDQITPVPGVVIEASTTVIKVAVTAAAKSATPPVADFIVNLKKPLEEKEVPAVGFVYGIPPATTLVGTYDTYTPVKATDTTAASAQIVLRDGEIQPEKKKPVPAHKPAAGHKPAAAH